MKEQLTTQQTESIFDLTSQTVLKNEGVVSWHDCPRDNFRAEWREDGDDIIYNFYHLQGPHPLAGFEEGETRIDERGNEVVAVEHGQPVILPETFFGLLDKIAEYVFKDKGVTWEYETVPEVFSIRFRAIGGNRNMMTQDYFTESFFAILDANFPNFVS